MRTVVMHLLKCGPGHQTAIPAKRMPSQLLVVGVEEIGKAGIEWLVTAGIRVENKSLKKPGCMRKVPLGGAGIRHGLQHLIFRRQRVSDPHADAANLGKRFPHSLSSSFLVVSDRDRHGISPIISAWNSAKRTGSLLGGQDATPIRCGQGAGVANFR